MKQIIYSVNRKYGFADALQKSQKLLPLWPPMPQYPVYRLRTTDLKQYFEKSIIRSNVPHLLSLKIMIKRPLKTTMLSEFRGLLQRSEKVVNINSEIISKKQSYF